MVKIRLLVRTAEGIPLAEPQVHEIEHGNTLSYGPVKVGIQLNEHLGEIEAHIDFTVVEE